MPGPVLLAGQVRTTLGCLASAFAASSSASALALLPAHLSRDAEAPTGLPTSDLKQLSPRPWTAGTSESTRRRKGPELDVERAVSAAARRQARQRAHGPVENEHRRQTSAHSFRAPPETPSIARTTISPTPARPRRRTTLATFRATATRGDDPNGHTNIHKWREAQPGLSRPFSTSRDRRLPVLDRHGAAASTPPPFASSPAPSSRYATPAPSPARQTERPKAPEAPRQTEKAAVGGDVDPPRGPPVEAASMPGPSSSSQKPPRPPSPYGEINDLARHPILYDPVLAPRFPIILCHGERASVRDASRHELMFDRTVGLYGFDVRGPGFFRLHYWGDLLKVLRGKIGAEVFVTAVPGCARTESYSRFGRPGH